MGLDARVPPTDADHPRPAETPVEGTATLTLTTSELALLGSSLDTSCDVIEKAVGRYTQAWQRHNSVRTAVQEAHSSARLLDGA